MLLLLSCFSRVRLCVCPWNFSRQEYWSGLSFLPPGDLPDPGIEPVYPVSPALAGRLFTTEPPRTSF